SGFWHGASWTFGIWGALNGALLIPEMLGTRAHERLRSQIPGGEGLLPAPAVLSRMLTTFLLICITWVFFRSANVAEAFSVFRKIIVDSIQPNSYFSAFDMIASNVEYQQTLAVLASFIGLEWIRRKHSHVLANLKFPRLGRWSIYTAALVIIMTWGTRTTGTFIYFQF
ncbi:MAG: hypothetical protein AAGF85_13435, partial [Bacteroidota bacterium]